VIRRAIGPAVLVVVAVRLIAPTLAAQPGGAVPPARLAIIQAEDRRAATAADLLTLRNGIRSRDPLTAILAIRAVGRLERPALITDLLPALRFSAPEVRAEAANAIGQAAQGSPPGTRGSATDFAALADTLIARLEDEEAPGVRAALCDTLGRLPYRSAGEAGRAEQALVALAEDSEEVDDRLGVAKGLEALLRRQRETFTPSAGTLAVLRQLAGVDVEPTAAERERLRDARVRRLAMEALITAQAIDDTIVVRAAADPDPQVRRLAMRAAVLSGSGTGVLARGLHDRAPLVRLEALRGFASRDDDGACGAFLAAADDAEPHIVLVAIDQLAACSAHPSAIARLETTVNDLARAGSRRGWHRAAHAIVALATAAPERATAALGQFVSSTRWPLRVYAARAAAILKDRAVLETLAADADDHVVEAAIEGLSKVAGHDSDRLYIRALGRAGYRAVRAAAIALDGTPATDAAIPALNAAWTRLVDENRANSSDTRAAVAAAITRLGSAPPTPKAKPAAKEVVISAADLRRLAAPRARISIRDLGTFDIALFTSEAPVTVLRFATLAEAGYYNGLTFHRVVPNFVVQGGSPRGSEDVGVADFMRDEVGLWPHVRGVVGLSTRGRDSGDAQFFINLADNPRFDHEYTVFGQVLNGMEIVERILEADVIDRIEILP
jgi:cyclophilin family peptidyl-prolyl cis-trans isomerase